MRLTRLPISVERMPEWLRPDRRYPVGTIEWFLYWDTHTPPPRGRRISMMVQRPTRRDPDPQAR